MRQNEVKTTKYTVTLWGVTPISHNDKSKKIKEEMMTMLMAGIGIGKLKSQSISLEIIYQNLNPVKLKNVDISPFVDALVESGTLENDDISHLSSIKISAQVGAEMMTKVIITLEDNCGN